MEFTWEDHDHMAHARELLESPRIAVFEEMTGSEILAYAQVEALLAVAEAIAKVGGLERWGGPARWLTIAEGKAEDARLSAEWSMSRD